MSLELVLAGTAVIGFLLTTLFTYKYHLRTGERSGVWLIFTLTFLMLTASIVVSFLLTADGNLGYLKPLGDILRICAVTMFFVGLAFYSKWSRFLG